MHACMEIRICSHALMGCRCGHACMGFCKAPSAGGRYGHAWVSSSEACATMYGDQEQVVESGPLSCPHSTIVGPTGMALQVIYS